MRSFIVAFACGIGLLQLQADLPAKGVIGMLAVLALAGHLLFARRERLAFRAAVLACYFLTGFVWAGMMAQFRMADQLPKQWEAKDIELSGVVASLPQRFERGERFEFDVESVQTSDAVVPGRIMLSWYHGWDDLDGPPEEGESRRVRAVRPGERWRFTVRLKRPHGNANPYGFDYEAWLLERNIRATGTIRLRGESQRLNDLIMRPGYIVQRLREVIRDRFRSAMPDAPYLGVLVALTVGDQRSIPNSQWTVFNRTGITHLVSISGLHVTMVATLFAALVNGIWRRGEWLMLRLPAQKAAVVAGWLAAFSYTLLAGFEVPAQRTLYMLSVVALALWSGRNLGISRILLLALMTVLLFDPWAMLATGFWLSFGAVALLLFVGTARIGELSEKRAVLARWGATQWAVTVGSLPVLLFFFQQFSMVSPLANALAIPLVSFIITPLALLFAALSWPVLLHVDHWLLAQLMVCLEWLADWPMWQQAAPPLWALLIAVTGVVWLLLPRGFPARWLGIFLFIPALAWSPPRPAAGEAWVDVLDVGQGLAVVVRTAQHTLLYDTGPLYSADSNAGQRVIVPYLRAIGVGRLDALVVSHRDKDHAGGASSVREMLPVARILSSMTNLGGELCASGQNWEWDGVRFLILHPNSDDYHIASKKSNNLSCVLRIASVKSRMLLTADIEAEDERALIARSAFELSSDVLLVPHHGGSASSTPEFIAAVGAHDVVFSAGYRNAFKHPRPDVLERYAASRAWRTDYDGAVHVVLAAETEVSAWRRERRRYWQLQ